MVGDHPVTRGVARIIIVLTERFVADLEEALSKDPDSLASRSISDHLALVEHHGPLADRTDLVWRVGDEDDGPSVLLELSDAIEALSLEPLVAHCEDLVDDQDVRVDVDRHGEAQAHVHPR